MGGKKPQFVEMSLLGLPFFVGATSKESLSHFFARAEGLEDGQEGITDLSSTFFDSGSRGKRVP
jgi:hypothetical protein